MWARWFGVHSGIVANRFALIVGSQCAALPRLGFVEELASGLYTALTRGGGWQPVADSGLLLNPTVAELKREIKKAFAVANASSATLLISFLGHGSSVGSQDFRLLAVDSPGSSADSDTAVHLTQAMRERLGECQSLDGLVVLVDACEASIEIKSRNDEGYSARITRTRWRSGKSGWLARRRRRHERRHCRVRRVIRDTASVTRSESSGNHRRKPWDRILALVPEAAKVT